MCTGCQNPDHTGGRTGLPTPGYPDSLRTSLPSHLPPSCPPLLPNSVLFPSSSLFARYWCKSWIRRANDIGAACPPQPSLLFLSSPTPLLHFLHLFLSYPPIVSFHVCLFICSLILFIAVTPVWCHGQGAELWTPRGTVCFLRALGAWMLSFPVRSEQCLA